MDTVLYFIGCKIPRGADCDDGWKCRNGEYCRELEICSVTDDRREDGWAPCFGYFEKSEGCRFFSDLEQAAEYLERIKPDIP